MHRPCLLVAVQRTLGCRALLFPLLVAVPAGGSCERFGARFGPQVAGNITSSWRGEDGFVSTPDGDLQTPGLHLGASHRRAMRTAVSYSRCGPCGRRRSRGGLCSGLEATVRVLRAQPHGFASAARAFPCRRQLALLFMHLDRNSDGLIAKHELGARIVEMVRTHSKLVDVRYPEPNRQPINRTALQ